ncbi:MAG: Na+/H+ antiporter NhaC family protein [Spirochaetales bacterium]|nr:Na+/H+ antiporter NhaC family protein [Spirochaetales bacterium]
MSVTSLTLILLIVMIVAFVLSSIKLKSPDISMVVAAVVIAIVGTFMFPDLGNPTRYLVEGLFVNLDLAMLFIAASLFVNIYAHSGAISTITRGIVEKIHNKWLLMSIMGILMLIPGALTGAGSVSIFVLGGIVDTVLESLGISKKKRTVFIFFFAIMSAAAPPINLWTMLMTAQANMPYVGFTWLLLVPILIASAICIVFIGWGAEPTDREEVLKKIPEKTQGMTWWRILLPIATIVALFLVSLYFPWNIPVLGLPLMFVIAAVVAFLCDPVKATGKQWLGILDGTMEQVFPLVANVLSIGVLQSAMAATGVRGLIGSTCVGLPLVLIYSLILIVGPICQGCFNYGCSVVLGGPLIFMFNTMGMDVTVICAALSLIFPIGDCLPPSRIVGRLACEETGYKESYMGFLKTALVPVLAIGLIAVLMIVKPIWFTFLY